MFNNFEKNRGDYCIWQWCTTCGCMKIRDELFSNCIQELKIKFDDTEMEKGFCSLRNIRDMNLLKNIIELLCQKLTTLKSTDINRMLGNRPFYLEKGNKDDFLKFIIMEIWYSLERGTVEREKLLSYLKSKIRNHEINRIITHMNVRYERNLLAKAS